MANKWFLTEASREMTKLSFKGLERFAKILKEEIAAGAPGSLKDGVVTRVNRVALKVTVASTHKSGLPVPAYVEFGTPAHPLTPKTAKVLSWIDPATGERAFSMGHMHPGTAPNPYFRRGVTRATQKVKRAFK